jgi:hypothetical protein
MILFIPVGILLVFALVVTILGRARFNVIQSWIASLIAAISAWSGFLTIKLTGTFDWSSLYINLNGFRDVLVKFQVDEKNWVFGLLLISLLVSVLFNETNRITDRNNLDTWSGFMVITAVGLLVIMSRSLLAFIFAVTLLDIGLLSLQLISRKSNDQRNPSVLSFIFHSIGTFLILFGMVNTGNENLLLMSIGAIFRIGDFSFIVGYQENSESNPGQLVFTDIIVPLTTLAFFYGNGISIGDFSGKDFIISLWFVLGISLLIKVLTNKDDVWKQKAWTESFAWLGFYLILSDNTSAVIPFSIVFIALGGVNSFSIQRERGIRISLILLAFGLIGFPYTPSYGLWLFPGVQKPDFFLIVYDLFLVFLLPTVFYKLISKTEAKKHKEDWVGIVSSASPLLLLVVSWFLDFWLKPISIGYKDFVYPGLLLILFGLIVVAGKISKLKKAILRFKSRYDLTIHQVLQWVSIIFSFRWALRFFSSINKIISELVNLFTRVLDGEGGLLWAFVFLILLSTVFMTNRTP